MALGTQASGIDAVREIRSVIGRLYGADAVPDSPRMYKTKSKNAQEAHEAIRPTSAARTPEQLAGRLDPDQHKLYTLIWRRAVASQMEAAVFDTVAVDLAAGAGNTLRANGSTLLSPGFLAVYRESFDDVTLNPDDDERDGRVKIVMDDVAFPGRVEAMGSRRLEGMPERQVGARQVGIESLDIDMRIPHACDLQTGAERHQDIFVNRLDDDLGQCRRRLEGRKIFYRRLLSQGRLQDCHEVVHLRLPRPLRARLETQMHVRHSGRQRAPPDLRAAIARCPEALMQAAGMADMQHIGVISRATDQQEDGGFVVPGSCRTRNGEIVSPPALADPGGEMGLTQRKRSWQVHGKTSLIPYASPSGADLVRRTVMQQAIRLMP